MYSDDSTFNVVPVWQNKLQNMAYQDMLHTRVSHYSYDIRNNRLRLYPSPTAEVKKFWFEFTIPKDNMFDNQRGTNAGSAGETAVRGPSSGINNINTLPFGNIPYQNINSIRQALDKVIFLIAVQTNIGFCKIQIQYHTNSRRNHYTQWRSITF